jgi:hypothetical protein
VCFSLYAEVKGKCLLVGRVCAIIMQNIFILSFLFSAGEGEILFGPLSFLEVVGLPHFEIFEGKELVVIHVKININLKAQTIEDMIQKRQQMHNASFDFLVDSVRKDIMKIAEDGNAESRLKKDKLNFRKGKGKEYTVELLVDRITEQVEKKKQEHNAISAQDFLDNDVFRGLVIEMLDTDAMARSKMRLYLEDESLYISDLLDLSLSAAHRMRISHALKTLAEKEDEEKERAAEAICYLKGLIIRQPQKNPRVSALIKATSNGLGYKDLELLVGTGISINACDEDGETALFVAAQCGDFGCIESLVALKADVDKRNREERTPIFSAAMNGNMDCVKGLVELKATVNFVDRQGYNAFVVAAEAGHFEIVEYLKQHGATRNPEDLIQMKPIMLSALAVAIQKRQSQVVRFIVAQLAETETGRLNPKEFEEFAAPAIKCLFGAELLKVSNDMIR